MKLTKEEKLIKERERLELMRCYEKECRESGYSLIYGIDEAGRGPLCGPVVAGCCILPADAEILYLNDSKKLSEEKREELYAEITEKAFAWGTGQADAARIDEINILNATFEAMREAFINCRSMAAQKLSAASVNEGTFSAGSEIVLVDGNKTVPGIHIAQKAIVKGDANSVSVAAASILAKVTRDRMLYKYDEMYPEYGFAKHKGYGTKAHIEALKKYGPLDFHRKSFIGKFV